MRDDSILLVDDDAGAIQTMGRILGGVGQLSFASNGIEALHAARSAPPDVILLDAEMPGLSGFQVCELLKADPDLNAVPVIFVTSHTQPEFEVAGFAIGAADFVAKPVSAPLLLARVRTQLRFKRMADELRRITTVDGLTGLPNQRRFDESLDREWLRARRGGDAISLLMVDIDHFKLFNDRYGQPAGDACLRSVALALLGASLRPADLVARVGGEEFALLLPQTARAGAQHMAHRVLDAIEAMQLRHEYSPISSHLTVSVGVSCYDDDSVGWFQPSSESHYGGEVKAGCTAGNLAQAAQHALDAAKRSGRAAARLLDIGDADTPAAATDIAPAARPRRVREREPA